MRKFTKEDYEEAAKVSLSYAGMCRFLGIVPRGGNYETLKRNIKKYNIDISHFTGQGWNIGLTFRPRPRLETKDILKEDMPYSTTKLKERLFNEGYKERKCECCGLSKWNGKVIPLELHHINGDRADNRLENLQILCPNCHAQTEFYRGKNQKVYNNEKTKNDIELKEENKKIKKEKKHKIKEKRYCNFCGKELSSGQIKYCSQECAHNAISKRPSVLDLIGKLKDYNNNYCAVARYYNVSDNAIRKWIKLYKL